VPGALSSFATQNTCFYGPIKLAAQSGANSARFEIVHNVRNAFGIFFSFSGSFSEDERRTPFSYKLIRAVGLRLFVENEIRVAALARGLKDSCKLLMIDRYAGRLLRKRFSCIVRVRSTVFATTGH
jgi:hypothetical protein